LSIVTDMTFHTKQSLCVGDLVKRRSVLHGPVKSMGIVIKKRFKSKNVGSQKYTFLTYEVFFPDGEIQSLKEDYLEIVQQA